MTVRDTRRAAALGRMADHLLAVGLRGSSLRALAAAAGASDRMLLYYFADKDELLTATLGEVAARMLPLLEAAGAVTAPRPFEVLLPEIGTVFARPEIKPFMQLWLELAAFAGRGEEPYLTVAGQIADGFLAWIAERLDVGPDDRAVQAARLLATVEGAALLAAVDRGQVARAALSVSLGPRTEA
jgi:AcrR family transcriptional regulator